MAQELKVTVRQAAPVTVLDLQGDVTMFAETELVRAYRAAVDSGGRALVLNFAGTDYINSAGIAIIISLLTEARASDVTLVICGLSSHYQKIFRMVGLTQYAEVFESEDLAVQELQQRGVGQTA
ncbi:MAG TPA: STAS domain-containing protein [Chloroflexia bacterium]|nr:STAS domain-containing protein [Chloroflexia bacterium]